MAESEFAFSADGPKFRLVLLHHETPSKNPWVVKQTWTHFFRCPQCGQRASSLALHQNKLFCRPCIDNPRQPRDPLEQRISNAEHHLIGDRGPNSRRTTILTLRRSLIKLRKQQLGKS
jgi:hypothetical protein